MAHAREELALGPIGSFGFVLGPSQSIGLLEGLFVPLLLGDIANDRQDALGRALANLGNEQELAVQAIAGLGSNPQFVAGECFALPGALVHSHRRFAIVGVEQVVEASPDPIAAATSR